ncbi:MAG TPA: shikimate dehydrogenase [Bryobacteraceae bacterium]|nr:shikimate dehydrogenase [Bryobacteraceae bacterium]
MASVPKSLPRICVALGFSAADPLIRAAEQEIKDGNLFLELRLDHLRSPESGLSVISRLRKQNPEVFLLATCRHKQNAGGFKGSVDEQVRLLARAAESGARLLDLEIESAEPAKNSVSDLRRNASLIVSYHNFENTPALSAAWRRLTRIDADIYKIATAARKPSDDLRIAEFFRARHDTPLVAFAMNEIGIPTRILSLAAGCLFTYAAPMSGDGTAPGQIPAKAMRALYRADKLGKQTKVFGVIADPVAHSRSPQIHNRAFQAKRIDAVYLPFRVLGSDLGDWVKLAKGLPVVGFSVTIPHKQKILRHLDIVDPLARRIGAVNTVWRKGGKWRGTNTDVAGILRPLEQRVRLPKLSVLLAGYGGAARAAAFALRDAGAHVTITGRQTGCAEALARVVAADALAFSEAQRRRFDVLINATPVGMHPKTEESLFKGPIPARLVFDMVYNPHETLLLRQASEQGCETIHGYEMFLEQAAEQFEIWTGETAPRGVMRQAFETPQ